MSLHNLAVMSQPSRIPIMSPVLSMHDSESLHKFGEYLLDLSTSYVLNLDLTTTVQVGICHTSASPAATLL